MGHGNLATTAVLAARRHVKYLGAMYGTLVKIVIKPGKRDKLLDFLRWDAAVARDNETGTIRFDVWDVPGESDAVYLYEGYSDREAFETTHQANEPYKIFERVIVPECIDEMCKLFDFTYSLVSNTDRVLTSSFGHSGPDIPHAE